MISVDCRHTNFNLHVQISAITHVQFSEHLTPFWGTQFEKHCSSVQRRMEHSFSIYLLTPEHT
jgi:hypothetical protein